MIMAIKFNSDFYFNNWYYARAGGINLSEFNYLEKYFLEGI